MASPGRPANGEEGEEEERGEEEEVDDDGEEEGERALSASQARVAASASAIVIVLPKTSSTSPTRMSSGPSGASSSVLALGTKGSASLPSAFSSAALGFVVFGAKLPAFFFASRLVSACLRTISPCSRPEFTTLLSTTSAVLSSR